MRLLLYAATLSWLTLLPDGRAEKIIIDGASARAVEATDDEGISRPVRLAVKPGQLVVIDAEAAVQWMLLEPATKIGVTKKSNTAIVFAVPANRKRIVFWAFKQGGGDGVPVPRVYIFTVGNSPAPDPDEPVDPEPDNPNPPTPAPVDVPNAWGVGRPVYDAVVKLHANHRTQYCAKLADIYGAAAARLAALSNTTPQVEFQRAADEADSLLGADAKVWNVFGDAMENAVQAGMDAGKISMDDKQHAIGVAKEVAEALRLAGRI